MLQHFLLPLYQLHSHWEMLYQLIAFRPFIRRRVRVLRPLWSLFLDKNP